MLDRLRSARHALALAISNRVRWRRGNYREQPWGVPGDLTPSMAERIDQLNHRYTAHFEQHFNRANSLENYRYLHLLDRLQQVADIWPRGGELLDVGSKNFYYAPVLHLCFRPGQLSGVELEAYRVYGSGYSRYDAAEYYIRDLPNAQFLAGDFHKLTLRADTVCCFYPFVFSDTQLAWKLPLSAFNPPAMFRKMSALLETGGHCIMMHHAGDEAREAYRLCTDAGLTMVAEYEETDALFEGVPAAHCRLLVKT